MTSDADAKPLRLIALKSQTMGEITSTELIEAVDAFLATHPKDRFDPGFLEERALYFEVGHDREIKDAELCRLIAAELRRRASILQG